MEDTELQETVESILGKGARVVDCEKKSTVREEECLLVNGCRVALETEEERRLRDALLAGAVPDSAVLNKILIKAGVLSAPSKLETSLSVKSSVVTREQVTVARGGRVIDGRSRQTKQEDSFTSSELWEPTSPAGQRRWGEAGSTPDFTRVANGSSRRSEREDLCSDPWEPIKDPPLSSSASDDSAEDRPDFDLSNGLSKIRINGSVS
ncbi:hypothetical protein AAG570_003482 [Ranatra chinensis]|uniref:Uncharacterized protein n=1 Tax=Ranatra chinensis TaxID=642074 RepID=A0ABD0Y4G1_9HEMI